MEAPSPQKSGREDRMGVLAYLVLKVPWEGGQGTFRWQANGLFLEGDSPPVCRDPGWRAVGGIPITGRPSARG